MSLMDLIPLAILGTLLFALWFFRNSPYSHKARNKRDPHSYLSKGDDWMD